MRSRRNTDVVVIGVGNDFRNDDGAGPRVARAVRALVEPSAAVRPRIVEDSGEPVHLIDAWTGADLAVVVDATRSGARPGTIVRLPDPVDLTGWRASGSHGAGVGEALALGRVLDRLPRHLVVYGIEAASTDEGCTLDAAVADAAVAVADAIVRDVSEVDC